MSDVIQYKHTVEHELEFSDKAQSHILSFLKSSPQYIAIRFSVKKTGCSGLSYQVDYVTGAPEATDVSILIQGMKVVFIEKKSYPYLKGTYVDYVKQGLQYKFVFENPNQTGQCGCGESFTVD